MVRRAIVSVPLGLLLSALPACGEGDETGLSGVLVVGGPGRSAGRFVTPRGVSVDAGVVWVVDRSGRVQTLDLEGRPTGERVLVDGVRGFPIGVVARGGGAVVCDTHGSRLLRLARDEASSGPEVVGTIGDGFAAPQRAAIDAAGRLFVTEFGEGEENRVRVFAPDGSEVRSFGGFGHAPGRFTRPMGVVVVGDEVFVTDVRDRVVVYGTDGGFRREFGVSGDAVGALDYPYGICAIGEVLYVCEYGNHRLQRFDLAGRSLGVFGGPGAEAGRFHGPWDVAADGDGRLWICDAGNHRLVVVDPAAVRWTGGEA